MKKTIEEQKALMLSVLEETVKFYSKDPKKRRSVSPSGLCKYNGENNTHCAVGRCLTKKWHTVDDLDTGFSTAVTGIDKRFSLEKMLQKKYRGLPINFWTELQRLHDVSENWNKKGLSDVGKTEINEIKIRISLI